MLSPELDRTGVEYHFAHLGILRRKYLRPGSIFTLAIDACRCGIWFVRSTVRRRKVALVYTNTIVTISGAIGGWLAGVPVVWHVREILSVSRPVRTVLHLALRVCPTMILCVSNAVRDSLLREDPRLGPKCVVLYIMRFFSRSKSSPNRDAASRGAGHRRESDGG